MANPWKIAEIGWGFVVMGWLLSPIIGFLVNKFFACLAFETSRKLRELKINIIPSLKQMLRDVEEQRIRRAAKYKGSESDLATLEEKEKVLKTALYEAEDVLDLVEYYRTEKKVMGDGELRGRISWVQHLRSAAGICITGCKGFWFVTRAVIVLRAAQSQCAKWLCWLGTKVCRSGEQIPISRRQSNPIVQRLRAWSHSLDIKALCRSMQRWLAETYASACYYRDWSYEAVGININKNDDTAVDDFLLTIDGKSLRIQIEEIENIANDLKKSHKDSSSSEILVKDTNKESSSMLEDANKESSSTQEEMDDLHRSIKREVFGRDKEREHICSMLRKGSDADGPSSNSSKPYSVIGIHGIIGSGKSTLAQYVCDHEKKAEDKHFYLIMFSHVSTTFRVDKIFRDILEQMMEHRPSDTEGPKSLHKKLVETLNEKRFLLVLDDLWVNNENQKGRDILLDALNAGRSGSIILVTAQREDAAAALGAQRQISIPDLEDKDYLSLFMHHARPGALDFDGEYGRIGSKIANKLHSSPIAAVTVGKQLQRNTTISFWETTANDDVLNETMGALWWSYQQFGVDIRRCFAYCSTFPRGYVLECDELVRIWIAQGFIKTRSDATEELEDVGKCYFVELLTFSFLMQAQRKHSGAEAFTIHDLLHELAERVVGSDFHRIDLNGSLKDIPPGVRHVFIEINNGAEIAENYLVLGNLRTLIIEEHSIDTDKMHSMEVIKRNCDLEQVFERLFTRLRKLRVLIVKLNRKADVFSVPASIDQMKHLRYLGLHSRDHRKLILPSTFSKLYHMQTIDILPAFRQVSCCEDMANLIHLRHITHNPYFPNVSGLTSLQTLECFRVKKEDGYELKQLKHLNKLRGTLRIFGIIGSKEEALEAHLASKKRITKLLLDFQCYTWNPDVEAEVFESLCPPKDLVELTIWEFQGSRYPSWMLSRQVGPNHLQKLVLENCSQLASIPEDCEFFICLLEICILWCDWDSLPENIERLVSLQNLEIRGCHKIEVLPTLPQSLRKIRIAACHVLRTTCEEEGHENWLKIQHIPEKDILEELFGSTPLHKK